MVRKWLVPKFGLDQRKGILESPHTCQRRKQKKYAHLFLCYKIPRPQLIKSICKRSNYYYRCSYSLCTLLHTIHGAPFRTQPVNVLKWRYENLPSVQVLQYLNLTELDTKFSQNTIFALLHQPHHHPIKRLTCSFVNSQIYLILSTTGNLPTTSN
jgi:hypothetical protein